MRAKGNVECRAALGIGILVLACAAAPHVEVDALEGEALAPGQSFVIDTDRLGAGEPAWGPSARETARRALFESLRERGFEAAEAPDSADLRVAVGIHSETRVESAPGAWEGDRVHVERRRTGLRTPVGDVPLREETRVVREPGAGLGAGERAIRSRTLIVEITDLASGRVVWQGSSRRARYRERIDLVDLERSVRAIVARLR